MALVPHNRPWITAPDMRAVMRTLASGMIAQGEQARLLEQRFSAHLGCVAHACSSGTQAITLALRALDVGPGDEVLLPALCCTEVSDAIACVGARPVWVAVDPRDLLLDYAATRAALTPRTRAILFPHLYGHWRDIAPFMTLRVPVIEDFAQYGMPDRLVGDFGVFSFYATKPLCGGEGGMVVTQAWAEQVHALFRGASGGRLHLYPLSDLQAALVGSQLERQKHALAWRARIASAYRATLSGLRGVRPVYAGTTRFRFLIWHDSDQRELIARFAERGVTVVRVLDDPPFRATEDMLHELYVETTVYLDHLLSLPCYPAMTHTDVLRVCRTLQKVGA